MDVRDIARRSKAADYVLCETVSHGSVPHPFNVDADNLPPCLYPHSMGPAGVNRPVGHPYTPED